MEALFRFVILGDGYNGYREASTVILRKLLGYIKLLSPQPDFIFSLGDMVKNSPDTREELKRWKALMEEFYPITMFYPVIGNHEEDEGAFSSVFVHLPGEQLHGYKRTAFYFDHGDARFIVLNSIHNDKKGSYSIDSYQRQWLKDVLKISSRKYNFVMLHVPAFPTGSHFGESLDGDIEGRNAFWEIIDSFDVTGVFAGHEHNYCRRLIDKDFNEPGLSIKNSIYHITAGSAGASPSAKVIDKKNIINGPVAAQHYVVVDVYGSEAVLHAFDIENELIDSCSLKPGDGKPTAGSGTDIIIPIGAEWRYLDDGTDQGDLWKEVEFDDSSWRLGSAELGYGDGDEETVVGYGPDPHRKYITTYFRKSFAINDISSYRNLSIRIRRDDGAIIYINGREVYRNNMPSGYVNFKTLASKAVSGYDEASYQKAIVDAGVLKTDENVVAVEIHQASPTSSDISFNLLLLVNK